MFHFKNTVKPLNRDHCFGKHWLNEATYLLRPIFVEHFSDHSQQVLLYVPFGK